MNNNIFAATRPPKHHFFGFHDICAWNFKSNKLLSLEVDTINRPPLPKESASVGYVDLENRFKKIGNTCAFNYPQGSRMQWVGPSEYFITNNMFQKQWGSDLYDTDADKLIDRYPFSCYCIHKDGKTTFSINFSRLHRLGAYGYAGLRDFTDSDATPANDGIIIGNIETKKSYLLISISSVANCPHKLKKEPYGHHYITHLLLNPSNTRLAFLYRYPLADGGEITRLLTIGIDGGNMRCIATGFLSHFAWKDDDTIFIFGRTNNALDTLRSNPMLRSPTIAKCARMGKRIVKTFMDQRTVVCANFLLIKDKENTLPFPIARDVLPSDGHPMFCPSNRDWIINDTYPDSNGIRTLMAYQFSKNRRINLGIYKMIREEPDTSSMNNFFEGVEVNVLNSIGRKNLAFTRSGLHCDLHPRWDQQGHKIAFDSIHEGTRQIYVLNLSNIIKSL